MEAVFHLPAKLVLEQRHEPRLLHDVSVARHIRQQVTVELKGLLQFWGAIVDARERHHLILVWKGAGLSVLVLLVGLVRLLMTSA